MTTYTFSLTPTLVNRASEGSMDTSVTSGKSHQRTGYLDIYNSTNRKVVELKDGATTDDVMQTLVSVSDLS